MKHSILHNAALIYVILIGAYVPSYSLPFHRGNLAQKSSIQSETITSSRNATESKTFGLKASLQKPKYGSSSKQLKAKNNMNQDDESFFEEVEIDLDSFLGPEISWRIENDFFRGHVCILIQDHPRCNYDFENQTDIYFEIQVQGQFKKKPTGPIYLGIEIPKKKKLKLSWPMRAFFNAAMAFIKSWGYKWVHSHLGEDDVQMPIISSPAFQAFDRLVITPKHDKPPQLGYPIPHNDNAAKMKAFKLDHKICTENIYTMSFNHSYVDIARWRVTNIPLVKTFSFDFTDSLRLTMYEIDDGDGVDHDGYVEAIASSKYHRKQDVVFWVKFEKTSE